MKLISGICGALILFSLAILATGQTRTEDVFTRILKPDHLKQCGLDKLSTSERAELEKVFLTILESSVLGDSAVAYLEDDGWEHVKVLGTRQLKLDEFSDAQDYLIVEESPWTYVLEPRGLSMLSAGYYLGKMSFSSCEIIDTDGDIVDFWTKETR